MENLLRVGFGEVSYFAKVLSHTKNGFEIETSFPVEGIKYSETSSGEYDNVSYFEERVLKAFRENLIFSIELIRNRELIKQKLKELEFSLMIFIDEEQSTEKQQRIRRIFGEQFFKSSFPFFEFTEDMVEYLVKYLDVAKRDLFKDKRAVPGSYELFLESIEQKTIHSIIYKNKS